MKYFLRILLAGFLYPVAAAAQQDTLLFVEPGISLRYDPARFRILRYYGHPGDGASYDLAYTGDATRRVEMHLESKRPAVAGTAARLDSVLLLQAPRMQEDSTVTVLARDTVPRHVAGFSCLRFVLRSKDTAYTFTALIAAHLGTDDYTLLYYSASGDHGRAADDAVLAELLGHFQSYSPDELAAEAEGLRARYTVVLQREKTCTGGPMPKAPWCGTASVQQPLAHKVVGAEVGSGVRNIFTSGNGRTVSIQSYNRKKGPVSEEAVLILAALSGNRVKLPFRIRYNNP